MGSVADAKLGFLQKVRLLNSADVVIGPIVLPLIRLNEVRNRLSHNLERTITDADRAVFVSCQHFSEFVAARGEGMPDDPLSVLEYFAQYAGQMLDARCDPDAHLVGQALAAAAPLDPKFHSVWKRAAGVSGTGD